MIEMLLVGAIVLVATLLFDVGADAGTGPATPGTAAAGAVRGGWCPDWIGRRIRAAASGPGVSGGPCDGCSSRQPRTTLALTAGCGPLAAG